MKLSKEQKEFVESAKGALAGAKAHPTPEQFKSKRWQEKAASFPVGRGEVDPVDPEN
jgi:hypothetical protein